MGINLSYNCISDSLYLSIEKATAEIDKNLKKIRRHFKKCGFSKLEFKEYEQKFKSIKNSTKTINQVNEELAMDENFY